MHSILVIWIWVLLISSSYTAVRGNSAGPGCCLEIQTKETSGGAVEVLAPLILEAGYYTTRFDLVKNLAGNSASILCARSSGFNQMSRDRPTGQSACLPACPPAVRIPNECL